MGDVSLSCLLKANKGALSVLSMDSWKSTPVSYGKISTLAGFLAAAAVLCQYPEGSTEYYTLLCV